MRIVTLLLLVSFVATGCYHATVVTGKTPGPVVIDQPFALSFVYGLVPPPTVETMSRCPAGVAIVETEQSVVNSLVAILTGGLLTPMHIKVTCADPSRAELNVPADGVEISINTSESEIQDAFRAAADAAVATDAPVYVRFE